MRRWLSASSTDHKRFFDFRLAITSAWANKKQRSSWFFLVIWTRNDVAEVEMAISDHDFFRCVSSVWAFIIAGAWPAPIMFILMPHWKGNCSLGVMLLKCFSFSFCLHLRWVSKFLLLVGVFAAVFSWGALLRQWRDNRLIHQEQRNDEHSRQKFPLAKFGLFQQMIGKTALVTCG